MALLFWDASALAKRYCPEVGTPTVNALFAAAASHGMATTAWGYLETFSILVRRLNQRSVSPTLFSRWSSRLQLDVLSSPGFSFLPISDTVILSSTNYVRLHSLNAADAAILTVVTSLQRADPTAPVVLLSSDQRLCRAARLEGLRVIDPEQFPAADVPAYLASL